MILCKLTKSKYVLHFISLIVVINTSCCYAVGADYQLGAARVFIREALHRGLERARADKLRAAATKLQAHVRGYLARSGFVHSATRLLVKSL